MFNFFNQTACKKINDTESSVDILFITYNRFYFTKETLPALLSCSEKINFRVTVVDNASDDETRDYLENLSHPNLRAIVFNSRNLGLVKPTLEFWKTSRAPFVGKIDNDILVGKGWIEALVDAHQKVEKLGVVGCSHFRTDDYDEFVVADKVETINGINIRRQPWIGGNYIAKRKMFLNSPGYHQARKRLKKRILHGFNGYQRKLGALGYIQGYLADEQKRLLQWTHLDDPREPQFVNDSEHLKIRNLTSDQIIEWYKRDAKNLLEEYCP